MGGYLSHLGLYHALSYSRCLRSAFREANKLVSLGLFQQGSLPVGMRLTMVNAWLDCLARSGMQGKALDDDYPGGIMLADPEGSCCGQVGAGNGWSLGALSPPMVFSIRSGDSRIGSFILHKPEFCAGDVVLGNFDFSGASTRCLQVLGH